MFAASLEDDSISEERDSVSYQLRRKTPYDYDIVENGVRGTLRLDGSDLILEWANRLPKEPERRLTPAPPNLQELRADWEKQTGLSAKEVFKEDG
jgi:hypothetical protein